MTPGLALQLEALDVRHPGANAAAALALRGCSVQLQPGEQVAVIGPSGAGKTTLLHAAACALPPAGGRLLVGGQDPWALGAPALRRLRAQLFLAPQTPPLPPRQRVVTAVLAARLPRQGLWASLATLLRPRRAEAAAAHAALQAFDLGDKLWARVDRLSGGERQRVGLTRALLAPAGLWLIDEPLSALDPTRAQQALRALTQGAQQSGATLLATLHQVELALAHFPRVLGLREGQLVFDLPAAAVTREQLAALYQSHEHELAGAMPGGDLAATPAGRVLQIARC